MGRTWELDVDDVKFVLPSGGPLHLTRLDLLKWQGESGGPAAGAGEALLSKIRRRTNGSAVGPLDATMITRAETRCYRRRR